jgi:hypothetical protein
MSYLAFGEFVFHESLDTSQLETLSWRLFKYGVDQDVCLFLGCNIPQQIVFEMLGVKGSDLPTAALPFLATGSPLDDTSDALLSPYARVGLAGTDMHEIVRALQQLHGVFAAALGESAVRTITFFITEGFDTDFTPVLASVDEFQQAAAAMFRENGTWPSARFVIQSEKAM